MRGRPTSFDIAALAGVSQPTVSRALRGSTIVSEATRRRIEAIAHQLNYQVDKSASNLRSQQTNTIALLFFEDPTLDDTLINPFFLAMLGSITRMCALHGYDLLISFQDPGGAGGLIEEGGRNADGCILLGYGDYEGYRAGLDRLVRDGVRFVRWGAVREGHPGTIVGCDNVEGGRLATAHLLALGRRRIAFVGTASNRYPEFQDRYAGYLRAHAEAGVAADDGLRRDAFLTEDNGRAATAALLAAGAGFDAVFAATDLLAIGAMHALAAVGLRVPEDVAVVGFDDIAAAQLASPPLTSVIQDTRRGGEALVERLLAEIAGDRPENVLLPSKLVVRGSSRPA